MLDIFKYILDINYENREKSKFVRQMLFFAVGNRKYVETKNNTPERTLFEKVKEYKEKADKYDALMKESKIS